MSFCDVCQACYREFCLKQLARLFILPYLHRTAIQMLRLRNRFARKAKKRMSFRFEDLPAELRDLVYGFYAAEFMLHNNNQLSRIQCPPLAQVSKIVRKNFLSVFIKQSEFDVIVGPRYPRTDLGPEYKGPIDGKLVWKSQDLDRTMGDAMDVGDPIFLLQPASLLIDHADTFHNVKIELHQLRTLSRRLQWVWRKYVFGAPFNKSGRPYVAVSLRWANKKLEIQKWPEEASTAPPDAPRLFERTIRVARKIASPKNFKGFTVRDLRVIAIAMVAPIEG